MKDSSGNQMSCKETHPLIVSPRGAGRKGSFWLVCQCASLAMMCMSVLGIFCFRGESSLENPVDDHYRWQMLGTNWWMMFVDGWAQFYGEHVFDNKCMSFLNKQDGRFLTHVRAEYEHWARRSDSWKDHRWTVDSLAEMNARLRGCPGKPWFSHWAPRVNGYCGDKHGGAVHISGNITTGPPEVKRDELIRILEEYYDALDKFQPADHLPSLFSADPANNVSQDCQDCFRKAQVSDPSEGLEDRINASLGKPSSRLLQVLPLLARLFASLAELHPFQDANSRTRLFVLQIELVKLGSHPVINGDNSYWVYWSRDLQEVQRFILDGFCNHEYVTTTGLAAFTGNLMAELNNKSDACMEVRLRGSHCPGACQGMPWRKAFRSGAAWYNYETGRCEVQLEPLSL